MYNYYLESNVITFARGDVNGDNLPDNVFLTGIKILESRFIQNITLIIQDGMTGMDVSYN